jgi:hypothetical protein
MLVTTDRGGIAGELIVEREPAARRKHAGALRVDAVDQHRWCQRREVAGAARVESEDAGDAQSAIAQGDLIAHPGL